MPQVELAVILKSMDEFADDAAAQMASHGTIEVKFRIPAVGADEFTLDGAIEGLRTLSAEWWGDRPDLLRAGRAQV
jgi:hypothetical protein